MIFDGSFMVTLEKNGSDELPQQFSALTDLAMNLWWTWSLDARLLFSKLDIHEWEDNGHNPIKMLKDLPNEVLNAAARDPAFLQIYQAVQSKFHETMDSKNGWFAENVKDPGSLPIVYFSAEYGLHHCLPFYAGGLGFLAGDHLKECSDLGVPLMAMGFMYPEGYLRQKIRSDGWQENVDEALERDIAPIIRVPDEDGGQLVVKVPLIDPPIYVAVWKVAVGHVHLYLLDTDIDKNDPWNRKISAHLYIGDIEQRLRQEIVLGIGGSEALSKLGMKHSIMHLNEGHPAFALLERIRERVEDGMSYEEAASYVKATSIFTTHTPVPAGHDIFPFYLIDKYFNNYYPILGLDRDAFHRLGQNPADPNAGFNMTALALRMSAYHNGVSKKHGQVARQMWSSIWSPSTENNEKINHITNGVHVATWIEPNIELLFNRYLGSEWLKYHDNPVIWDSLDAIPDQALWNAHQELKSKLFDHLREQARKRWFEDNLDSNNVVASGTLLNPWALTIGFARRFAAYKRADLIFYDLERLKQLINNKQKPLQIIFAGKAHPADDAGKRILQRVFGFAHDPNMGGRVAFVEDYGELLAQYMVHGVNLWLNNPMPPMEASGTSGMKASLNGVPQISILDGWWIEGYNGKNGWAFSGRGGDKGDSDAIYSILENEVIPKYYEIDDDGIPRQWIKMMKEAIKSVGPRFCARRMVKEYIMEFYEKALKSSFSQS